MSAYKELKEGENFLESSKLEKTKQVFDKAFNDPNKISGKVFDNLSKGAKAFGASIKETKNPIKALINGLSAMSATAKTTLGVFAAVTVAIAAIKIVNDIIDKANDNTEELLTQKDEISQNISEINSELDEVNNQIAELESKRLNITNSSDISALNTQIELLKQRKELLEWQEANKKKEAKSKIKTKLTPHKKRKQFFN